MSLQPAVLLLLCFLINNNNESIFCFSLNPSTVTIHPVGRLSLLHYITIKS